VITVTLIYDIKTTKTRFKHPPHPIWHNARGGTKLQGKKGTLYVEISKF